MGEAHHGGFGHGLVQDEGALHLRRAQPVAGDVHHVVHAPGDPVVAVGVAAGAVAGEVEALVGGVVGIDDALMIAVERAELPRPGCRDHQVAGGLGVLDDRAVRIHQGGLDAEEGTRGRAGLQLRNTGQRRDHDAAGLGLPPRVHHRAAAFADHAVVPLPRFGIDGLADGAEDPQARAAGAGDVFVALTHELADGGGRGVEDVDAVLVDDPPAARGVGVGGHAFEHQRRRAVGQRAVDDVRVTGDPADVGGAPVDVAVVVVEDVLVRHGGVQQVAAGTVLDPLGLTRRTGGIEDEKRILGVHDGRLERSGLAVHEVVVPDIAAFAPRHVGAGPADGEHRVDVGTVGQRHLGVLLERHRSTAPDSLVGGDQRPAVGVEDAILQRLGREAAEDHRVDGADARAGEHGVGGLRDHRHVDAHPVALGHAAAGQSVGEPADGVGQLPVGDALLDVGLVSLPDDRHLVGPFRQMAVDTVDRGVEGCAFEPAHPTCGEIVGGHLRPLGIPVDELPGAVTPECVRIRNGLLVEFDVARVVDVAPGAQRLRYGIGVRHVSFCLKALQRP